MSNSRIVADRLDEDERRKLNLPRQGETWFVTESGLYAVIVRSDKPNARKFRKWVTSEVLPSIRKTGSYNKPMTTARKLYAFLEMDKSHYSRWVKANIVDNEFATENEDYFYSPSMANESSRGNFADDYKLTAHFAKKLSMKGNGEKAEEAREYFTHLEERMKQKVIDLNQLSPELQMFQKIFNSVAEQQLEQKRQAEQLNHVEQRVESIREVVALDTTSWRDDTGNILRKISMELGGGQAYSQVRAESYELLSKRMGVNLKQRLTNKRRRMADEGICKSTRDKLSYVDIIAEDKKLIEGYTAIVKEMAIRYGVGKD